jgi:hypothetical protein
MESRLKRKEKLAPAIAAAIAAYLKQEEKAIVKKRGDSRSGPASVWGQSGRQDTMQLKRLFQLRLTGR